MPTYSGIDISAAQKGLNGFTPEPEKHHIRIQLDGCTYEGDVVKV